MNVLHFNSYQIIVATCRDFSSSSVFTISIARRRLISLDDSSSFSRDASRLNALFAGRGSLTITTCFITTMLHYRPRHSTKKFPKAYFKNVKKIPPSHGAVLGIAIGFFANVNFFKRDVHSDVYKLVLERTVRCSRTVRFLVMFDMFEVWFWAKM